MQTSTAKQEILDFLKSHPDGATYTDLRALGYCQPTLRRWIMELEHDGLAVRSQAKPFERVVFTPVYMTDVTQIV